MTTSTSPTSSGHASSSHASSSQAAAGGMRQEISSKWNRISPAEIAALKNTDDLVVQVMNKYALERVPAQRDVEAFAKGRKL